MRGVVPKAVKINSMSIIQNSAAKYTSQCNKLRNMAAQLGIQPSSYGGTGVFKDKNKPMAVQSANILAARAVADAVRTSLGPRGADKLIETGKGENLITNDGFTMLKSSVDSCGRY